MISRMLKRAAGLCALMLLVASFAHAQTAQIEGTVKLKAEDGTEKPVVGAMIDIYRTDIKGQWEVKTDKAGHYLRLGLPVTGTFLVAVSGPGIQPTFNSNVRLNEKPIVNFTVTPGDGSRLTKEQIQKIIADGKASGGASSQPAAPSPADRAKAEAAKKEYEAKVKENQELQQNFDQLRARYNQGIELKNASNYQAALSEFEAASVADPTKHSAFAELAHKANAQLAEAHYQLGVEKFNAGKRDEAKQHFEKAVTSIQKAITVVSAPSSEAGGGAPQGGSGGSAEVIAYYNILTKNALLLVEHYGVANLIDSTGQALDKAQAIDSANKSKWAAQKADLYRFAGRTDEAAAAYKSILAADPNNVDALYGLGLTLIASQEKAVIQEGTNALADFVSKAPATDKRMPAVKEALEAVKNAYKIEAEKPSRRRGKP
jgi:tetratricopeptide (TPR) repeat protein